MKKMAELITDDWMPSKNLYEWAKTNRIELCDIHKCVYEFIFWHKEKKVRRSNFNLAFKNWLKKEFSVIDKQEVKTKMASPSYASYVPRKQISKNRPAGRGELKKMKTLLQ